MLFALTAEKEKVQNYEMNSGHGHVLLWKIFKSNIVRLHSFFLQDPLPDEVVQIAEHLKGAAKVAAMVY
jgi:hypothetical protein